MMSNPVVWLGFGLILWCVASVLAGVLYGLRLRQCNRVRVGGRRERRRVVVAGMVRDGRVR
jgi:hypothetical protein